jgi:hypothetical protein
VEGYAATTADVYDHWYCDAAFLETEAAVKTLAELAGAGPALELSIGTGRIAVPLAVRGIEVHGIDASEAMLAKLRKKPGGDTIPVTIGAFTDIGVEGTYRLVYLVFNTLFALPSQAHLGVRAEAGVAPDARPFPAHPDALGRIGLEQFVEKRR